MKKKVAPCKPSAHYKELQSRVQGLNAFRRQQNYLAVPTVTDATPGAGAGHGSDAKALTRNAIEDFALAPILGLDRREVAASSFVYGTEEQYFHKALTILHALQRLRRRHLLATAQDATTAAPDDAVPTTPRSSAFTWDLVDLPADDGAFFDVEDDKTLPDIPEDQGDGAVAVEETLDSLKSDFDQAVESLEGLRTAAAKQRANRLRVRFSLLAHDIAPGSEAAREYLTDVGKVCKVKHNHKPPSVPGGGNAEVDGEGALFPSEVVSDDHYSAERQVLKHLERCTQNILQGSKNKRDWQMSDEKMRAFWQPLTMLGRARLLAILVEKLKNAPPPEETSMGCQDGAPLQQRLPFQQQQRMMPMQQQRMIPTQQQRVLLMQQQNAADSDSSPGNGSSDDDDDESPEEEEQVQQMLVESENDELPIQQASSSGAAPPAVSSTAEKVEMKPELLLAVLGRGLEFVECPEKREHITLVAKALLAHIGAEALSAPGAKTWMLRLTADEREHVAQSLPLAWSVPQYVAAELRLSALPPKSCASATEMRQWATSVGKVLARMQEPKEDSDKLLMAEMRVYAMHHVLIGLERAAWLESSSAAPAETPAPGNAPVLHVQALPVTVPQDLLTAYLNAWRPAGSGGFVPEAPSGKKAQARNKSVCLAAAQQIWGNDSVPATRRRSTVVPDADEALGARLLRAAVAASGPGCAQGLKVNDQWLQRILAETTLTSANSGAGPTQSDMQNYAKAKVNLVELTERTEVEFEPCNKESFSTGERAEVLVRAKNCGVLAIRVFEVDAWRYYVANGKEVPSDLSLEGLEPNVEVHVAELQQQPPLRRSFLRLHLPFVERGGVFVLELIGNGVSCRALLHVGALHLAELQRDATSQTFAVYDHAWKRQQNVTWLVDGSEQESTDGTVVIPHVNDPKAAGKWTKAVIRSGTQCTLFECLRYGVDNYELRGGFFVDEEQLQEGSTTVSAICRAQLFRDQECVPLSNLKSTEMRVWWQFHGSSTYQLGDKRTILLSDDADHVASLEVPRGARLLKLDLESTLASGKTVALSPSTFEVQGVAQQCSTDDIYLCPGFELQALGRSGEPVSGRMVDVQLQTWLSSTTLGPFKCKTDMEGRIPLGSLHGVVRVIATFSSKTPQGPASTTREWHMTPRFHSSTAKAAHAEEELVVFCADGGEATIPVHNSVVFVLEEVRLESYSVVQDLTHLATLISGGTLQFSNLPAGRLCRLRLWHPDGSKTQRLLLRADKLTSDGRFATVEQASLFEWRPDDIPPYFARSEICDGGKSVRLQVQGAKPGARLHLVARRFWRPLGLTSVSCQVPVRLPSRRFPAKAAESAFLRTRRVGDIIRYVLERRPLASHPEFSAPSLPAPCTAPFPATCVHGAFLGETNWAVRGDAAGEVVEQRQAAAKERPPPEVTYNPGAPKCFETANVAFVEPSEVVANVQIGSNGSVEIKMRDGAIFNHAFYEVVLIQPNARASVVLTRDPAAKPAAETPRSRDMRLLGEVLDPSRHYGEVYGSRVLQPGEVFELSTPSVSRMQVYYCLPQIFDALLALLNRSPALKRFEYLKTWPELDEPTKLSHYSSDACHELHLFLWAHDRPFFDRCVAPLLANRRRYGRLDRWLLCLPPEAEPVLGPLSGSRLEQLLLAAQAPKEEREQRLTSLLRLAAEDATEEAASISLQRRTKAYDVMLQPHSAQLEPECSKPVPARMVAAGRGGRGRGLHRAWGAAPPRASNCLRSLRGRSAWMEDGLDEEEGEYSNMLLPPSDDEAASMASLALSCSMMNQNRAPAPQVHKRRQRCASNASMSDDDFGDFTVVQAQLPSCNFVQGAQSAEREAWYSQPAHRVTERAWLTPNGLTKKGAALWREVARCLLEQPGARWPENFASAAALEACLHGSVSEAIVALALLNLPFSPADTSSTLGTKEDSQVRRVTAGAKASVVFFSMVQEVEAPTESSPLLITQELRTMAGNLLSRSSELMVNSVITAQVLVVNCGAEPRELRLLLQCPEGAIPVGEGSFYTRSVDVEVPAFGSTTVQNYFYFPSPGSFRWFPAHALAEEKLVAFEAVSAPLRVVNARGAVDAASWRDVAARGSLEDVLAFLRRPAAEGGPPRGEELAGVAWRMRDAEAYRTILTELRKQLRFSKPLWGYGFLHGDLEAVREFLVMDKAFKGLVGPRMESGLLTTEALDGSVYAHCDFAGLVLSRAHTVGVQRQNIEDSDLRDAYQHFLAELSYAAAPSLEDRVLLTNFMLLQDRVDEARVAFEPVKEVLAPRLAGSSPLMQGPLQMQAAYHMAYLDLIGGGSLLDAKLAIKAFGKAPWLTTAWRQRFEALQRAVEAALEASAGAASSSSDAAAASASAAAEGAELLIKDVDPKHHGIQLSRKRLRPGSCQLACYVVDVELTFSASPFAGTGTGEDSSDSASHITAIAPTVSIPLADAPVDGQEKDWVPLPESVRRRQMVLEVVAAAADGTGKRLSVCRPCYFCDAEVTFDEKAGTLKVMEAGKPALGTYVKVFAAAGQGSSPKFYKDGYTDCLGIFDYVSLNSKKARLTPDSRLAVLAITKEHGAMVRVLPAPPMVRPNDSAPGASSLLFSGACTPPQPKAWGGSDASSDAFSSNEEE